MIDIVNRLEFDAVRCELQFSKGVAGNIREAGAEIERLRADLAEIRKVANVAPADDTFGSLAVRMNKVWLLARGHEQNPPKDAEIGRLSAEVALASAYADEIERLEGIIENMREIRTTRAVEQNSPEVKP